MTSAQGGYRTVRKRLADGTVREYRYPRKPPQAPQIRAKPGTIDALLMAYRRSPEFASKAPKTRRNHENVLRVLDRIGHLPVAAIRRRMLYDLRDAIAAKRGPGAATQFARVCSALFAWAADREWLDANPAARLQSLPGGHFPPWSEEDAAVALRRLPEHLRRVVVLALYTGQRLGDLIAMRWRDWNGDAIRVAQIKGRRKLKNPPPLVIPCHRALRDELALWRAERPPGGDDAPILLNARGKPWMPTDLSHAMATALAGIGLRDRAPLNVHGLRKLAAARLAEAGCTPHQIASITGHRTLAMVEFYTRSAEQERLAREAIRRLEGDRDNRP